MKKTIIALSVLAAASTAAQAQNVSITGIADAMYLSGKHFGQTYREVGQNGARTSSIQIVGSEDLGGGLRANFRYEVQPLLVAGDGNAYNTNGTGFAAGTVVANGTAQTTGQSSQQSGFVGKGYSFVGLSGNFGAVEFGTINSNSFATLMNGTGSFGTGIGSGYNIYYGSTGTNTFTRFENSVNYRTPTINGFQGALLYSAGNNSQFGTTTGVQLRRQSVTDWGLSYTNGAFTARAALLSRQSSSNEAAGSNNITTTTTTASASYTVAGIRLGAAISNIKDDNAVATRNESESMGITASYPMGPMRLMVSYGSRTTNDSATATVEGRKTTITGFGGEYTLSKRTFAYARYETGKRSDVNVASVVINGAAGAAGPAANPDVSRFGIGVSHQF